MLVPQMRMVWPVLVALGACSSSSGPSPEREPTPREPAAPSDAGAPEDAEPGPDAGAAGPAGIAGPKLRATDEASKHMIAVRDRLQLVDLSKDGKRALLAVQQPVAHAPELRVVDIDTGKVLERVEMFALARLPKLGFLQDDKGFAERLDAAIQGNRLLGEELERAGALLAGFGGLHGRDFAASADGKHVAYTPTEHGIRLAHDGDPVGQRFDRGTDPWMAPDGTTLLYKDSDPYKGTSTLWAVPFAGGTPRRIQGTEHLYFHSDPIVRPDGTLRVACQPRQQSCFVDIDLAKLRVTRTICLPREYGWQPDLAISPSGDWVAWIAVDEARKRSRIRVMELARRKVVVDTTAIDVTAVHNDHQLVVTDAGRVYTSVGTSGWVIEPAGTARGVTHDPTLDDCRGRSEREIVCVRDGAVVVLDLDALRGDDVPLRRGRARP
jgi:hypothetical protein